MADRQFAALPFRVIGDDLSVLLITTRRKRRWSVPKGSPIAETTPHGTPEIEAYEEAGLIGKICPKSIGRYRLRKRDGKRQGKRKAACDVQVFPLKVKDQLRRWPERGQREAIWLPACEAARLVHKPELSRLIERFARQKSRK